MQVIFAHFAYVYDLERNSVLSFYLSFPSISFSRSCSLHFRTTRWNVRGTLFMSQCSGSNATRYRGSDVPRMSTNIIDTTALCMPVLLKILQFVVFLFSSPRFSFRMMYALYSTKLLPLLANHFFKRSRLVGFNLGGRMSHIFFRLVSFIAICQSHLSISRSLYQTVNSAVSLFCSSFLEQKDQKSSFPRISRESSSLKHFAISIA